MTPKTVEVYIDGASSGNPGPAGMGAVFVGDDGGPSITLSKYLGETTNNVAEYLALVYALLEAQQRGIRRLLVKTDSELVAKQMHGEYKVRDAQLRLLHDVAVHAARGLEVFRIEHISRTHNTEADRLAGHAIEARFEASVKRTETEG